ncbi:MAG: cytochrome b N-terminal domain-containing protein [Acidobacteriota bacterium]|nr:cytochrome b N-terminal domain-containing protein [Acidobacteriota bacterium]
MRLANFVWKWFDEVTGVSGWLFPLARHPVPHARRSAWFYVLGSATLLVFIVQVVTGVALTTAYVPSSGQAYHTLAFIDSTRFGSIVHGIHYYGASAMVILIGIHAIRVYLFGAYKYPRQMGWITGAILLFLVLGMAFTGQLLKWDQTGYWSVMIAAQQAGRTPFIGNWLAHFIIAGNTVGGATLSRFFALHVFFIPALIFFFIGFHLYLVIRNGISEPPKMGRVVDPKTYRPWYQELVHREGVPFWPDAAWRDAVFGLLVIACVVALAVIVGAPALGKPPDPSIIQASPRPDWYFLWYFALLAMLPPWSENYVIILGPLLLIVVLILLPILASKGERSPFKRPWSFVVVAFIVFMIAFFGVKGHVAPWSPRMDAPPLPASVVGTSTGSIAAGAVVFHDKGCEFCHSISGYGGLRGPDLSYAGDRMNASQIVTRIYSGATNMPSYNGNITQQELQDLVAFLESRRRRPVLQVPAAARGN